ncbi:MAG: hypothetical protein M0R77_00770 [Gammaproteobacteria bacterium]|nr:hypothetical protein [Acholeplasmataceae bacterium]MCK9529087.1 hypothetical protein [Gammaproteobacteria bacterium]
MATTIKGVFDELCSHLIFDDNLLKKVNAFRIGFLTRNEEHIKFFGGNLTGVEVVRFTPSDADYWTDQILGVSETLLTNELRKLPTIIPSFKVSSDTLNNSFIWMMHKFLTSSKLSKEKQRAGAFEVAMVMNYRYLTSRLWNHFRYPADPEVAAATYAALSRKFALKQYGNWTKTLEARSSDIIDPRGIHYKKILTMDDDIEVRKMINDTQLRIRSMIKNIVNVHFRLHAQGVKMTSSASVMEHEGEMILKDQVGGYSQYYRYLLDIISDKRSFVKPMLTNVIIKAMSTMPEKQFYVTLNWLSDNSKKAQYEERISKLITDITIHAFNYLYSKRNTFSNTNDIGNAISSLKGAYSSSRTTDPLLISIREQTEELVAIATNTRHKGNIASVRTGVLLYIVTRALTKQYFSKN